MSCAFSGGSILQTDVQPFQLWFVTDNERYYAVEGTQKVGGVRELGAHHAGRSVATPARLTPWIRSHHGIGHA